MVIFTRKREVIHLSGMAKLGIVSFISAIGFSLITSVWAIYLDSFFNSAALVGFILALLSVVSFASYFIFIPLIEKYDKEKIYSFSIILMALAYLSFSVVKDIYAVLAISVFLFVLVTFRITSFGIIVKDKSSKTKLSQNEGVIYTFANTAWAIGPLIAGLILAKLGISFVFIFAAFFLIITLLVFQYSKIKDHTKKKKTDDNMYKNFKDFFKDKDRVKAYLLGGGISFWWILIYIYLPLDIIRQGLAPEWVGYFLFAVPIPLILLECKFSKLAGKIGFKKMFRYGYLIAFACALVCFFLSNIYFVFLFLILGSVGMAMLEPSREAYFFDICDGKEHLRFFGPFNTSVDTFKILGKLLPALLLVYFDLKVVFLLFAFVMFLMFLLSYKIRDVVEAKKRRKKRR